MCKDDQVNCTNSQLTDNLVDSRCILDKTNQRCWLISPRSGAKHQQARFVVCSKAIKPTVQTRNCPTIWLICQCILDKTNQRAKYKRSRHFAAMIISTLAYAQSKVDAEAGSAPAREPRGEKPATVSSMSSLSVRPSPGKFLAKMSLND